MVACSRSSRSQNVDALPQLHPPIFHDVQILLIEELKEEIRSIFIMKNRGEVEQNFQPSALASIRLICQDTSKADFLCV